MRRVLAALAGGWILAAALFAAEASPKPTLALVGGRIIDGYEGTPIDDGVILIAGERIVAVGPRERVPVPAGIPVIDTRGMSVLPGLADMHVHLMILGHGDYEHWDAAYRCAVSRRDHAGRRQAAAGERRDGGARPGRRAPGQPHGARPHQQGRDPGSPPLRLGPFHPARSVHRVGEGVPLGRQRPGRCARQGPEDRGRRCGRREADRPGPDDGGGSEGRRRHGPQGRQARRGARAPRGRDPDRPEVRRRLLRAHGHGHLSRVSRRHPRRDPQAQPVAGVVPDGRAALPRAIHGRHVSGAAERSPLAAGPAARDRGGHPRVAAQPPRASRISRSCGGAFRTSPTSFASCARRA